MGTYSEATESAKWKTLKSNRQKLDLLKSPKYSYERADGATQLINGNAKTIKDQYFYMRPFKLSSPNIAPNIPTEKVQPNYNGKGGNCAGNESNSEYFF